MQASLSRVKLNLFDEQVRLDLMEQCAYAGVQSVFGHLAVEHMMKPPRQWFDAKLARQVAIHILNHEFDVPRNRIAAMQGRKRGSVGLGRSAVDRRLKDDVFRLAYLKMAGHALALYEEQERWHS